MKEARNRVSSLFDKISSVRIVDGESTSGAQDKLPIESLIENISNFWNKRR